MRLLNSSPEEILKLIENMKKETGAIKENVLEILWWMRGSVTIDTVWDLTVEDIKILYKKIKKNIETMEKSGLPTI